MMSGSGMPWSWLIGGAVTSLIGYANLPASWLLPLQGAPVCSKVLATAKLSPLAGAAPLASTDQLWRQTGAVVMAVRRPG